MMWFVIVSIMDHGDRSRDMTLVTKAVKFWMTVGPTGWIRPDKDGICNF